MTEPTPIRRNWPPALARDPAQRHLVKDLLGETARQPFGSRCIYGGERCYGLTCSRHRDLVYLDPALSPPDPYGHLKEALPA